MSKLAEFSYTLYVIHYPLLLLSFSLFHPSLHGYGWMMSLLAAMAVVVPVVYISSRVALVVENRRLLRRLALPGSIWPKNMIILQECRAWLLILAADWHWSGKGLMIGFDCLGVDGSRIATPTSSAAMMSLGQGLYRPRSELVR